MRRLRISAISYLNTAPLMWDFEHGQPEDGGAGHRFDIAYTLPSACARDLEAGTAGERIEVVMIVTVRHEFRWKDV